jgi:hypothetical protein
MAEALNEIALVEFKEIELGLAVADSDALFTLTTAPGAVAEFR